MAGGVITRNDFRVYMADGMRMQFDEAIASVPDQFTEIYDMQTSDKAYETELGFVGMGAPGYNAELDIPRMDAPRQGRPITYIMQKFGLGTAISYEAKDDARYGDIVAAIIPELKNSFGVERNTQAASLWNNAFTAQAYSPDGVAFVATNHPLIRGTAGITTISNKLVVPLSTAGLQAGRTLLRKNRTESGKLQPLIADTLVVGVSNWSLAEELINSTLRTDQTGSGTGNVTSSTTNNLAWQRALKLVVLDYMIDDGRWFLLAPKDKRRVKWFDRKKLYTREIADDKTEAMEQIARARWAYGYSDWRGVVGSTGVGS